jgi:hypothetical protein
MNFLPAGLARVGFRVHPAVLSQTLCLTLACGFALTGCSGGGSVTSGSGGGGGTSNPTPSIAALSPSSATAGSSAFTLTVTGSQFMAGSAVNWDGQARTTVYALLEPI